MFDNYRNQGKKDFKDQNSGNNFRPLVPYFHEDGVNDKLVLTYTEKEKQMSSVSTTTRDENNLPTEFTGRGHYRKQKGKYSYRDKESRNYRKKKFRKKKKRNGYGNVSNRKYGDLTVLSKPEKMNENVDVLLINSGDIASNSPKKKSKMVGKVRKNGSKRSKIYKIYQDDYLLTPDDFLTKSPKKCKEEDDIKIDNVLITPDDFLFDTNDTEFLLTPDDILNNRYINDFKKNEKNVRVGNHQNDKRVEKKREEKIVKKIIKDKEVKPYKKVIINKSMIKSKKKNLVVEEKENNWNGFSLDDIEREIESKYGESTTKYANDNTKQESGDELKSGYNHYGNRQKMNNHYVGHEKKSEFLPYTIAGKKKFSGRRRNQYVEKMVESTEEDDFSVDTEDYISEDVDREDYEDLKQVRTEEDLLNALGEEKLPSAEPYKAFAGERWESSPDPSSIPAPKFT